MKQIKRSVRVRLDLPGAPRVAYYFVETKVGGAYDWWIELGGKDAPNKFDGAAIRAFQKYTNEPLVVIEDDAH